LCRNEALRVAFIHDIETLKDGKPYVEHYSKLVKADIHGKDQVFPYLGTLMHFLFIFRPVLTFSSLIEWV